MSNIAGKAYAINLVTPIRDVIVPINKLIFWSARQSWLQERLSNVCFARWLILRERDFPHVAAEQPEERLRRSYVLLLGSVNANLQQCIDQLASSFPNLLSWLCLGQLIWPNAMRRQTLQRKIARNQVWTDYFYSSYPMASANDIRSAERVKRELGTFIARTEDAAPAEFMREYHALLKELQADLGLLSANPIVSMAARDQAAYVAPEASDIPDDTDVYRAAVQQSQRVRKRESERAVRRAK